MMKSPYFPDILLIVEAVDNRPRAEEKHCFEERMGANVKESKLWLVKANCDHY